MTLQLPPARRALAALSATAMLTGIVVAQTPAPAAAAPVSTIDEVVYVSAPMDSDRDRKQDRIAVHIRRPSNSSATNKVSSIVRASPYYDLSPSPTNRAQMPIDSDHRPGHFGYWYTTFFNSHNYASVEIEMQGTGKSQGCPTTGGKQDTESIRAVIEWLSGKTIASRADRTPVVADWSTGNSGMIGLSYEGTLPIAVAATGEPGLKAIVPIGAISSWYDYTRAQGIGYYGVWGDNYARWLATLVANPHARAVCGLVWDEFDRDDADGSYAYNDFWAERNYRASASKITAAVWQVHGQRDDNVKTTQVDPLFSELDQRGRNPRLWLHDDAHIDPFETSSTKRNQLVRWLDHYVNGADNGYADDPKVSIDRPDGTRKTYPYWPARTQATYHFGAQGAGGAGSLVGTPQSGSQTFSDGATGEAFAIDFPEESSKWRLAYLSEPLTSQARLSGTGLVKVAFSSSTTSTPITAMLVHYNGTDPVRRVTRGSLDAKNVASIIEDTPLVPGQQYTGSVWLEPKDYVFPAGSRIGLVIMSNDYDYLTNDPQAGDVTVSLAGSSMVLPGTFPAPPA